MALPVQSHTVTAENQSPDATRINTSESEIKQRTQRETVERKVVIPEALSYHILGLRDVGPADIPLLGEAYRCWSEVWKQAFSELESRTHLPSDEFSRQDEVGAIFHGYECIALSLFRWVDMSNKISADDSYFYIWPQEAREEACSAGPRICISSHVTIPAPWRRARGCSLKDVLGALVVERFLLSDADTVVGVMRNDRGMNSMAYRKGARALKQGVMHHGVPVDLVAFHRESCTRPALDEAGEALVQTLLPRGLSRPKTLSRNEKNR